MSDLREFILYRVLRHKFYVEKEMLSSYYDVVTPDVKNVCAKVPALLSDRLDEIVAILDVSKRSFIERALLYAVETAEAEFRKVLDSKWTEKELEQMVEEHESHKGEK